MTGSPCGKALWEGAAGRRCVKCCQAARLQAMPPGWAGAFIKRHYNINHATNNVILKQITSRDVIYNNVSLFLYHTSLVTEIVDSDFVEKGDMFKLR